MTVLIQVVGSDALADYMASIPEHRRDKEAQLVNVVLYLISVDLFEVPKSLLNLLVTSIDP